MTEEEMQQCLDAGDLPGTPSEVLAIEKAYDLARRACALAILTTPLRPGFVLELCREWLPDAPHDEES